MAEPASPGWYPDPERPERQRWWNGLGWSDARRPVPGVPAGAAAQQQAVPPQRAVAPQPTGDPARARRTAGPTNGPAASGLGFGIVGTLFGLGGVPALVAVVLSGIGVVRGLLLARSGVRRNGVVAAAVGLVLGVVGVVRAAVDLLPSLDITF